LGEKVAKIVIASVLHSQKQFSSFSPSQGEGGRGMGAKHNFRMLSLLDF